MAKAIQFYEPGGPGPGQLRHKAIGPHHADTCFHNGTYAVPSPGEIGPAHFDLESRSITGSSSLIY